MDSSFRPIYLDLLERYQMTEKMRPVPWLGRFPRYDGSSLGLATRAIEIAMKELPGDYDIRPDSVLFLTVNLHQMVTAPLTAADQGDIESFLSEGIRADAISILRAAASEADAKHSREISAADVVRGLARVLDKLNLKSWRLWEDHDRPRHDVG